jgi:hypothetical protein
VYLTPHRYDGATSRDGDGAAVRHRATTRRAPAFERVRRTTLHLHLLANLILSIAPGETPACDGDEYAAASHDGEHYYQQAHGRVRIRRFRVRTLRVRPGVVVVISDVCSIAVAIFQTVSVDVFGATSRRWRRSCVAALYRRALEHRARRRFVVARCTVDAVAFLTRSVLVTALGWRAFCCPARCRRRRLCLGGCAEGRASRGARFIRAATPACTHVLQ